MSGTGVTRRLAAILAADVAGYSRLMGADEAGTRARFNDHLHELIEPAIATQRGRIVKTTGDGLLVEFASVVDAVQCAVEIQKGMAERNADEPDDRRMAFRIGVNLGDVIVEGDDIHGDGVNVAARLEGLAEPGGVCVSGTVFDSVRNKLPSGFEDLGEQEVKNIAEPVRAYRVLPEGQQATAHSQKKPPSRWRIPAIAAAVLVVIAAGGVAWRQPWAPDVEPASVDKMAFKLPDKPSIAVLPFSNLSGDKEQDYFADGLTEDIITSLASFPNLFVIARNSTAKFNGKAVDIRDVAHDLGVRYVLEGSVRRAGNTLRITAQLIDALSGNHIWAKSYDRELKDIFALQDEITGEIGSRLVSKVVAAEFQRRTRKGTRNTEAYDLLLRGWKIGLEFNPRANARAIQVVEQAIAKDPKFARAYAFLAFLRRNNASFRWAEGPKDTYGYAMELAQKAVALDPRDSSPYQALSRVYHSRGQYDRAIDAGEKAVALSPSNPDALMTLAFALAFAGRGEDAVRHAETAMRLDPHGPWYYPQFAGYAYYMAKRFDEAAASFERARRLNPRTPVPVSWSAAAHAQLGRTEEARAAREAFMKLRPGFSIRGFRATLKGEFKELVLEGLRKAGFPENPPLKLPDKPSIAVLPFTNMSDDKRQGYFSDGITEDIITDLSKVSGLFVIARNSSFKYRGNSVDVREVARDLGVRHVLEGSVRRSADQLRITVKLVDATTGGHIWAVRYDRAARDVFAIQDEIAAKVAAELAVTLNASEQERLYRRHTDNLEAYETFLRARRVLRPTEESVRRGKVLFERIIELDPRFAGGYAGLSHAYAMGVGHGFSASPEEDIERANALARRAVALDDSFGWSYLALGGAYLMMGEHDKAVATMREAVRVQPSDADAHLYMGFYLHWAGRGDEAIDAVKTAMRHNPNSGRARQLHFLGFAYFTAGRYEDAISTHSQRYAEFARTGTPPLTFLAAAYAATGQIEKARAAMKVFLDRRPGRTIANYRHPRLYKRKEDLDRYLDLLRKAGMPE